MRARLLLALAMAIGSISGPAQDLIDMNLGELRTNCVAEIQAGHYTSQNMIQVVDFKVLAWYRQRDDRPYHWDSALCWARVATEQGAQWVLVHMARNPLFRVHPVCRTWGIAAVTDVPNRWFLYFEKPPRNPDIYGKTDFFELAEDKHSVMYDSCILEENWLAAIGEKPEKRFPNKIGPAKGSQPSGSDTNRASAAAGSRR
jgi:hypothetical protein